MPTIVTVKPSGGGDFTTLQDAVDFIATKSTPDWWIEIHHPTSGFAELDAATVNYSAWSSVPSAANYPKIYAASDSDITGAALRSPQTNLQGIVNSVPYLRIEGLWFGPLDDSSPLITNTASNVRITGNMLAANSVFGGGILIDATDNDITGVVIANNFIGYANLGTSGGDTYFGIELRRGGNIDVAIVNDTIVGANGMMHAPIGISGSGTPTVNVLVRNSILCSDGTGGNPINDPDSAATVTADHNISNGSAIGSFSLGGQTTSSVVINSIWDLRINDLSPAYNAGALDSVNAPTDALGTVRPIGAAADVGAYELDVASPPVRGGLLASYYAGYTWVNSSTPFPSASPDFEQIEATVDRGDSGGPWFDGGADVNGLSGDPPSPIANTNFAVAWTGSVVTDYSEDYTFEISADDGNRLWVNGVLVLDFWNIGSGTVDTVPITMTAGVPVPIRLEYFQYIAGMHCVLSWSSTHVSSEIIPPQNLVPDSSGLIGFVSTATGAASVLNSFKASESGTFRIGYTSFASTESGVAGVLQSFGSIESGTATITNSFGDMLNGLARVGYSSFGSSEPGTAYILNPYTTMDSGIARVGYSSFGSSEPGTFTLYGSFGDELSGEAMIFAGFGDSLSGLHRVANDSLARFELYHGVGGSPDFTADPESTFTALPFTTSALTTDATHHFVLRQRNAWNLQSQNINEWVITTASDGSINATPPSDPVEIAAAASTAGTVTVTARYLYSADGSNAADSFLVYLAVNATPVIGLTVPIAVSMIKSDGIAKLSYTTAAQTEGAVVNVIVRTRRTGVSPSPNVDSIGTTVYSATATLLGPAEVTDPEIFQGTFAEQAQ